MKILHSKKLKNEKDAFVRELFENLPSIEDLTEKSFDGKAASFHRIFLSIYILNHYSSNKIKTKYFKISVSNLIEAELLFILGFRNSAFSMMRSALECAFKFLYYEFHPIESQLDEIGQHQLSIEEYRNFGYKFPKLCEISFFARAMVERVWSELCQYVHSDLRVIEKMSVIADIETIFELPEKTYQKVRNLVKETVRVIILLFIAVDPDWGLTIEKVYFEEIFHLFKVEEIREIKNVLQIT
jgi:hypothetical protein